jgi:hypothetical protein
MKRLASHTIVLYVVSRNISNSSNHNYISSNNNDNKSNQKNSVANFLSSRRNDKGDIINVRKAVETKSIFMRANALKMVNGFC